MDTKSYPFQWVSKRNKEAAARKNESPWVQSNVCTTSLGAIIFIVDSRLHLIF